MSAASAAPANGAELLARIKPTMRRVETYLCLRPDLLDAWQTANEELAQMRAEQLASGTDRLAAGAKKKATAAINAKAREVQKLEDEIDDTQVLFVLEKMPSPDWNALIAQFPPRKDNMLDYAAGYDRGAAIDAAVRECLVDPVFDDESYAELLKILGPSEWDELRECCQQANGKVVRAPKSDLAARILTPESGTRSRPPKAGG